MAAPSPLAAALRGAARSYELTVADEAERERKLTLAERFARDPFLLADEGHIWVYDKDAKRTVRMQLYPTQRELGEAWIDLGHLKATGELRFRNVIDEKSRQMGETWGVSYLFLWALHYHARQLFAHHQRKAELDDGGERNTWRSLFGKVRYMDARIGTSNGLPDPRARERVPGVMGLLTFRAASSGDPARVENRQRGGVLYAGEQSANPGRGGTFDGVVVDEAAFIEWGEKAHGALDDACPEGKLYLSTVNGDSNVHARLADERPAGWLYLRHHWSQHPVYARGLHVAGENAAECELCRGNEAGLSWSPSDPVAHRYPGRLTSPWYDKRIIGKTDEQVAQELDIDRARALSGRVYSEFQPEWHVAAEPFLYDDKLGLPELAFDYGVDVTAVVICQEHPHEYRVIGEVEMGDEVKGSETATADNVARAIRVELAELGMPERFINTSWTRKMYAIGDPGGASPRTSTLRSDADEYRLQGFSIGIPPAHLTARVETNIRAVKRLLLGKPKPLLVSPRCERFIRHAKNNTWPTDPEGRRRQGAPKPADDIHNHMMRAFAYLVVTKFPPPREEDGSEPLARDPSPAKSLREKGIVSPDVRYGMHL